VKFTRPNRPVACDSEAAIVSTIERVVLLWSPEALSSLIVADIQIA
jgi:hypothetical protein